jgi:D-alanyl-D-alanine carboxypeptidase
MASPLRELLGYSFPVVDGLVVADDVDGKSAFHCCLANLAQNRAGLLAGQDLAAAIRELVGFDGLGLDATWWEIMEAPPEGSKERAHQFLGDLDVTDFVPYFDLYGGGGIATTMGDLARFQGALFRGRVYSDPATVDIMLSTLDGIEECATANERSLPPGAYRMGVWVLETEGFTSYHHTGFWGTLAVHIPELDLTIAATSNQHEVGPGFDEIPAEVIRIVAREQR